MSALEDDTDLLSALDFEDGPAPSRAERRDQQIARIMEAAKTCFVRSGFQGASMQQICAECGMSPGALYRYFPSKEAIIEAITEEDRRTDAVIFTAMQENPCVVEGVVEAAMAHIRHMHECGKAELFTEIRAESMRNEAVQRTCIGITGEISDMFQAYFRLAMERGEIDPCVEIEALLPALMAIGEGFAMNDLPALGVPWDRIETIVRTMIVALLRPVSREGRTVGLAAI